MPTHFTFEIIGSNFSRDKNNVYYRREIIIGADPPTFKVLSGSYYAKDKNGFYGYGHGEGVLIKETNPIILNEIKDKEIRYSQ